MQHGYKNNVKFGEKSGVECTGADFVPQKLNRLSSPFLFDLSGLMSNLEHEINISLRVLSTKNKNLDISV